jgi:hypothetical protein
VQRGLPRRCRRGDAVMGFAVTQPIVRPALHGNLGVTGIRRATAFDCSGGVIVAAAHVPAIVPAIVPAVVIIVGLVVGVIGSIVAAAATA